VNCDSGIMLVSTVGIICDPYGLKQFEESTDNIETRDGPNCYFVVTVTEK
jgi:hypothetical protein